MKELKKKIDETCKCSFDFSCLWMNENRRCGRCKIDSADGDNILFLKGRPPSGCPYSLIWGSDKVICHCPTYYALHTRFPDVQKVIGAGVLVTDENDIIINTNNRMEQIAGIPAGSIVGTNICTGFPKRTVQFFLPYYKKAKKTHECQRYENITVMTPAGRQSNQSGWLIPKVIHDKVVRMVCTVEDVTESNVFVSSLK